MFVGVGASRSNPAICEASFSSTRCSRIRGSRMSKRGWRARTVLLSRSRSFGASNRIVGAVITSTGRDWKSTSAAEQIPSKRRSTTARESSAGNSSTGPVRRTAKRRRQGVPEATLTARSRARKLLQHLGSPPRMPTAWSDHSPWTSHWVSEAESIESSLARWTGSWFMSVWGSAWDPGKKPRRRAFHRSDRASGEARQPTDHWPCSTRSTSRAFFSQKAYASSRLSNPRNSIRLTCSPNLSDPVSYLANQRFVFISLSKFRYTNYGAHRSRYAAHRAFESSWDFNRTL